MEDEFGVIPFQQLNDVQILQCRRVKTGKRIFHSVHRVCSRFQFYTGNKVMWRALIPARRRPNKTLTLSLHIGRHQHGKVTKIIMGGFPQAFQGFCRSFASMTMGGRKRGWTVAPGWGFEGPSSPGNAAGPALSAPSRALPFQIGRQLSGKGN